MKGKKLIRQESRPKRTLKNIRTLDSCWYDMQIVDGPRPNAYILRLGDHGPGGLNQEEALMRLFEGVENKSELWFAIGTNNPGQLKQVEKRLMDDGWWFCASWRGSVRFAAQILKVVTSQEPQPVPSGGHDAWTKDGKIAESRCWVQLDPETMKQVKWRNGEFLTWQSGKWASGFPRNQTALLRAVVPNTP